MTNDEPKAGGGGPSDKTKARFDREAAALRANLARRKAQKRGQADTDRQNNPRGERSDSSA